jgi:cytochrome c oxidase cbb3-type subunit 3
MYMSRSLVFIVLMLLPALSIAAVPETSPKGDSFNAVFIVLVSLVVVLFFAIAVLAVTLKQLSLVYRDRLREQRSKNSGVSKTITAIAALFLLPNSLYAETVQAVAAPAIINTISGIAKNDFYLLAGTIIFELLVLTALLLLINMMVRWIRGKEVLFAPTTKKARRSFWERFHNVVSIEKEQDILLDHDYDGIKELDNSLPPWWKYGFYFTIVVAVVYLYYFHGGGNGPSSIDEYTAEVRKGETDKEAYLVKSANNIDENTVKLGDVASIAAGAALFQTSCFACHQKDGGGGVGPNLADDYWLHGGSVKDIFKSIKYGWPDKGMKSWKDDFSPKQIADLSSFIKSLKGTKPAAPKEKQGELFIEMKSAPDVQSADSAQELAMR